MSYLTLAQWNALPVASSYVRARLYGVDVPSWVYAPELAQLMGYDAELGQAAADAIAAGTILFGAPLDQFQKAEIESLGEKWGWQSFIAEGAVAAGWAAPPSGNGKGKPYVKGEILPEVNTPWMGPLAALALGSLIIWWNRTR